MREILANAHSGLGLTWPIEFSYFLGIFFVCFAIINFVAVFAGLATYFERKIAGHMQSRVGPDRVGPHGLLQWGAGALELILKEDIIPTAADKFLFRLAPYVVFAGSFAAFIALPYSVGWSPAGLNIGLLYILAVSSSVVIGILMAGGGGGGEWGGFGGGGAG